MTSQVSLTIFGHMPDPSFATPKCSSISRSEVILAEVLALHKQVEIYNERNITNYIPISIEITHQLQKYIFSENEF